MKTRHRTPAAIVAALAVCGLCSAGPAADAKPESPRRERPVQVALDIDLAKFEGLTADLLSRRAASH
jgi:hypothetical protein